MHTPDLTKLLKELPQRKETADDLTNEIKYAQEHPSELRAKDDYAGPQVLKLKLKLIFVYTVFLCNTLYWILLLCLFTPTTCFDLHTRPSSGGYIQAGPCYTCH
jgi:hypothetical protein